MRKTPKEIRKEFKKDKRNGKIYKMIGTEKDSTRSLHHEKEINEGGDNSIENLFYLPNILHDMYHHFKIRGECVEVKFQQKVPTYAEAYDVIEEGVLMKTMQDIYMDEVINELKNWGR